MKLDKKLHEQQAKRLSVILNPQSTFAAYLTRPEFMTILKLELNTLAEVEKKLPDDKLEEKLTAFHLANQFTTLTKTEFKLGEKFKYDDNDDLIDNINYLPTYCKNIFKVDIDDLVKGKKVVASNPNIDLRAKPDMDDPMMDGAAAFNMGAMGYAGSPYENPFVMGKAYGKLNKDIAEGKVYQYKTKPKMIVVCKYLLLVLLGLSMLGLVATAIFCFMANGLSVYVPSVKPPESWLATITNGIFYLITAGFGVYVYIVTIKSVLKKNGKVNENALYQFSWYFYLAFIILGLLISLLDLRTTWFYQSVFNITEPAGSAHYVGFWGWKIGVIEVSASTGLCIIPMILGAVFAPKQDKGKLEELLKQYINEVSPMQPTGPEVQKPVDVKPSEPKKDEPKKDSTKPKK